MSIKIKKAAEIGFCFGVRRAIDILETIAQKGGEIDTLGALVHNEEVLRKLSSEGINVINGPEEVKSRPVAISAHGVSPQIEAELRQHGVEVIDTTCPSVRIAQKAAYRLAKDGFFVVVYGEANHSEVKGILGWAQGKGLATLDIKPLADVKPLPRRIGILSQTTQIPENFLEFIKKLLEVALSSGTEIRIVNTICHGAQKRQAGSLQLARRVDLMLIIGGRTSANSQRLLELCSTVIEAHLIANAEEIDPEWLKGKKNIGITSGTSTSEQTIDEVMDRLKMIDGNEKN
jgi:4-hydroxy-3-methylbut-2-enyl diphosphate reductase